VKLFCRHMYFTLSYGLLLLSILSLYMMDDTYWARILLLVLGDNMSLISALWGHNHTCTVFDLQYNEILL
jgi:hypothetical protein